MSKRIDRYKYQFYLLIEYNTKNELRKALRKITMEMSLRCKFCGGQDIVRYGRTPKGVQRYMCKKCHGVFLNDKSLPYMRTSIYQIGSILGQYYGGMPFKEIRRQLKQQYGILPSRSTLYRQLIRFTKVAMNETKKHVPEKIGEVWVADETVLKIGGKKYWLWDIIDLQTRFLLASHLSSTRTIKDAQILMESASERASKVPKFVITDKLASYIDGIELAWGKDAPVHIQSTPFTDIDSTNVIERFQGTIKSRTKVMRGLQNIRTGRLILDGFFVHYNFFRFHESLNDKTPSEVAGIKFPFKDWLDVVKSQSIPMQQIQNGKNIYIQHSSYPYLHSPRRIPRSKQRNIRAQKQTITSLSTIKGRQK